VTTPPELQLAQGDLRLLTTPAAADLLRRALPARMAYVDRRGEPRIVPTWFHWNGREIVMATWTYGPHVRHPARRIDDLTRRPSVAISIDTDDTPPLALQVRGAAEIDEVDGIAEEYALAAHRYLGDDAGPYLAQFDAAAVGMARIVVRPRWVGLLDFDARLPGPLGGVS
jgi:hypothetical protein